MKPISFIGRPYHLSARNIASDSDLKFYDIVEKYWLTPNNAETRKKIALDIERVLLLNGFEVEIIDRSDKSSVRKGDFSFQIIAHCDSYKLDFFLKEFYQYPKYIEIIIEKIFEPKYAEAYYDKHNRWD